MVGPVSSVSRTPEPETRSNNLAPVIIAVLRSLQLVYRSMYWSRTARQLELVQDNVGSEDPRKGTVCKESRNLHLNDILNLEVDFARNSTLTDDIMDLSLFNVQYRFLSNQIIVEGLGAMLPNVELNGSTPSILNLDRLNIYPNI